MEGKTIIVLDPTAKSSVPEREMAKRPEDLEGKALGLVDNQKPNADVLLAHLEGLLTQKHRFSRILHRKKPISAPIDEKVLAELIQNCEVVVLASGD